MRRSACGRAELPIYGGSSDGGLVLLGMFRHGVVPMPATTLCTARDIAQRIVEDAEAFRQVEEARFGDVWSHGRGAG